MNERIAETAVRLLLQADDIPTRNECTHAQKTFRLCDAANFGVKTSQREIDYCEGRLRVFDCGLMIFPRCAICFKARESVRWREQFRDDICGACCMDQVRKENKAKRPQDADARYDAA